MKILTLISILFLSPLLLAGQSAFDTESEVSSIQPKWFGFYEFEPRFFIHDNAPFDQESVHVLDVGFTLEREKMSLKSDFRIRHKDQTSLDINELYVSAYLGRVQIHAGNQVVLWGKGDELHIVDMLNADDYRDFFFPDYLRRRHGETMLRVNTIVGPYDWNANLELIYTPGFTKMTFPTSGPWQPPVYQALNTILQAYPSLSLSEKSYHDLDDGQFAARWTQTVGRFDLGVSWYRGKLRIPSVRFIPDPSSTISPAGIIELINNPVTVLGLEGETTLGKLNLRGEIARYITSDTDGNSPEIQNSKWSVLLGGDMDLPLHNMNLNIQYQKDFIPEDKTDPMMPGFEDIMKGIAMEFGLDPSLFEGGLLNNYYDFHLITGRLGDRFFRDRFEPEIQGVYNIDSKDYMITLKLDYELLDDLHLAGIYRYFDGDAGTIFGQFKNNDFVSLRMECYF